MFFPFYPLRTLSSGKNLETCYLLATTFLFQIRHSVYSGYLKSMIQTDWVTTASMNNFIDKKRISLTGILTYFVSLYYNNKLEFSLLIWKFFYFKVHVGLFWKVLIWFCIENIALSLFLKTHVLQFQNDLLGLSQLSGPWLIYSLLNCSTTWFVEIPLSLIFSLAFNLAYKMVSRDSMIVFLTCSLTWFLKIQ